MPDYEGYAKFVFTPHGKRISYGPELRALGYPEPRLPEALDFLRSEEHQDEVMKQLLADRETAPMPPVDPKRRPSNVKMYIRAAIMQVRGNEAPIGA